MGMNDWKSIGRGALIAAGGAVITYVATAVIPAMQSSGDGVLLAIAAAASVALNYARKWLASHATTPTNE